MDPIATPEDGIVSILDFSVARMRLVRRGPGRVSASDAVLESFLQRPAGVRAWPVLPRAVPSGRRCRRASGEWMRDADARWSELGSPDSPAKHGQFEHLGRPCR